MNTLDSQTLGDVLRFHAAHRPDKPAFETPDGGSVSFGEFNRRVNRLCAALSGWGVRKGDRVAILSRNRPEYVETFGASKMGFVVVPLNWRLVAAELEALLVHSAPTVLIVDEHYLPLIQTLHGRLPSVRHLVCFGPAPDGWTNYEALLGGGADTEPQDLAGPEEALCIVYTSGTTGAPKGVTLTHGALMDNCRTSARQAMVLTENDYSLAVLPLFHVGGMWYHLFPSFASGCTTLMMPEFEPGALLGEMEAKRVSNVHVVPTMINAMLNHPLAKSVDLSRLRMIFYAASSIPAELLRQAMLCFGQSGFMQSYGSTEAGMVTLLSTSDHLRASRPGREQLLLSCGKAMPGRQLRIVDDGVVVADGGIGEIETRSAGMMAGYWHDPNATARALDTDGWLKTGDLGYLDGEGYLYLVDRKNDMIVTGGENVYPTEVEAQFYGHPAVLEAAVFGVPDPQWVEKVVAVVVPRPGVEVDEQALLRYMREKLASYKCPKSILFRTELPKSGAGKVLRKVLRRQYGVDG